MGLFRGLEGPKCKNNATFVPQTKKKVIVKVAYFFHFGHSKPQKQPKTPQMSSKNSTKTTGSNDLGPIYFI